MENQATLHEMKTLIEKKRTLDTEKKKIADAEKALNQEIAALDALIMKFLEQENLKNFRVPGIGLVTIVEKESFATPKTNEEKRLLFDYIKNKYGDEDLMSKMSINSMTLNSWAGEEMESNRQDPLFRIPGLGEPSIYKKLSLRK